MRDYSKMTDEEFIKAYETPYTKEECEELDRRFHEQVRDGKVTEMTDKSIDAVFDEGTT